MASKRKGGLKIIPPSPTIQLSSIMNHADVLGGLYGVDSAVDEQVGYITDKNEFLIVSECNGYLRLPVNVMKEILKEALEVMEVMN